jgi:hypothetical protein
MEPDGRLAHRWTPAVKLALMVLDKSLVNQASPPPSGFLDRLAAAFAVLARYAGCSFVHHPLPEVREVGNEWRVNA